MPVLPETFREELYRLAFLSTGESSPNPPVSCLITDPDNTVIFAKGRTSPTGEPHAEKNAYSEFIKNGFAGKPHNVWVTLEPCGHHGKTPPCIDLILEHKPKTLYYGWRDPNPLVQKRNGLEECIRQGISVVQDFDLTQIASASLFGFSSRITKQRPTMIFKTAVSKEGFFASSDKKRTQLSGKRSSHFTSILRAKCDAVLVGPGTLFYDTPGLDFRISDSFLENEADFFSGRGQKFLLSENPHSTQNRKSNPGFSDLLQNVLKYGALPDVIRVHRESEARYQPYRVFLIFEEKNVTSEFIKKQKSINKRVGSKKCIFFLKKETVLKEDTIANLQFLSENEIYRVDPETFAEECLTILASIGVNLLMVEGGNLLYQSFVSKSGPDDLILKIQTSSSIPNGIKPDLKTGPENFLWKVSVEEDDWESYRCLQV
ncbi:bifunctional diaminohydroxyphosphoribosylaminopyrimidine deaminase/5-amino-6-(5-phosphoribosylamino)uracil reductase [Leptospira sp. WS92.C1]